MPQRIQLPDGSIAEFPDGMGDAEIESVLRREFAPQAQAPAAPQPTLGQSYGSSIRGLAKSGYNTFAGATQALAPLMAKLGLGNQFPPLRSAPYEDPGEEAAGQIGNVAQFFVPGMGQGGALSQMMKAAALSTAQGADIPTAALSGTLAGAGPLLGKVSGPLRSLARRQYGQALDATTIPLKAESQNIVPKLLERRVSGGLRSLMSRAQAENGAAGRKLSQAYRAAAKAGQMSDTAAVAQSIEDLKAPFMATTTGGAAVQANPGAVAKLDELKALIEQFGPKAPPDQLWKVRQNLDDIIQASSGFGKDLAHGTAADLRRQARTAIQRELTKADPNIESLNATYSLWKGLERVTRATIKRKEGQQNTLEHLAKIGIGGGLGYAGGDDFMSSAQGIALAYVIRSPQWRTVSAVQKARIADLLARGESKALASLLARLGAGTVSGSGQARSQ